MEINGHEAIRKMEAISKLPGGSFNISFYPCNLTKCEASAELKTYTGCRFRIPLPHDKWVIDGDHYFLFEDSTGNPKTCYKVLIRFVAFSSDNFKPLKVVWTK
jgi:hypothetical protein